MRNLRDAPLCSAILLPLCLAAGPGALSPPASGASHATADDPGPHSKYMQDYDFIAETVRESGAALEVRDIDWERALKRFRPEFEACGDDVQHVRNVMSLLALLHDSHTGVTRTSVDSAELPSKWDGLYGAGLWFGWQDGRIMLRGLAPGHALEGSLTPGSALVGVGELPAWLVWEREKRRITRYQGSSSDHSLFSSVSNRLLPFGELRELEASFLEPGDREPRAAVLPRWGPQGKAYYPVLETLPEGVEFRAGALSAWLPSEWCEKLGYLRITGSMDAATVAAFHQAFDQLEGLEALVLDCRSMGGGSDGSAWAMAGRFFPGGVNNGLHGRIEPSGSWQFDGPVVMLQNESEVSSAETFTWALSETGRSISVGRPTGGWGIIPKGFDCPSGLVSFRLGVNARPTPIERVQTEGTGWPPDVPIPMGPRFCAAEDPTRAVGLEILRVLHAGAERDGVAEVFGGLFAGDLKDYDKRAKQLAKTVRGWNPAPLRRLVQEDLEAELELELLMLELPAPLLPDVLGATRRLEPLALRAKRAGLSSDLKKLQKRLKALKGEAAAQETLLELLGPAWQAEPDEREAFLSKHGKTLTGRFARDVLWS